VHISSGKWLFIPDHITNDKQDKLIGKGIISNKSLNGKLTDIADKLKDNL